MDLSKLPEAFFHYLWKHKSLNPLLQTVEGSRLQILNPGIHNQDGGPDFLLARIRIDDTLWVGNVELHVKGSDWYHHKHHLDESYNNVILHVVGVHDKTAHDQSGLALNTLCLDGAFNPNLIERFESISRNLLWVPCMNLIKDVESIILLQSLHSRAVERLAIKAERIKQELQTSNNDWEECCYRLISKQFGSKVNISSFEVLCQGLPARILMKHHDNIFQLEALLFGQSGLLHSRLRESYPVELKKEYRYLSAKYKLSPMPGYLWKFLRIRPAGFPTLRIAQLASLYCKRQKVFQEIIEQENIHDLMDFFDLHSSLYWDTHYIFGKKSKKKLKRFGKQSIQLLLINAMIPLLHLYGEQMNKPHLCDRAIAFLEDLPSEQNAIVRRWDEIGVRVWNALESQGLIQLKSAYCDKKRCLECPVGHHLLKQ